MARPKLVALRRILGGAASALAACGLILLVFSGATGPRSAATTSMPPLRFAFATKGEEAEQLAAVAQTLARSNPEHPPAFNEIIGSFLCTSGAARWAEAAAQQSP